MLRSASVDSQDLVDFYIGTTTRSQCVRYLGDNLEQYSKRLLQKRRVSYEKRDCKNDQATANSVMQYYRNEL